MLTLSPTYNSHYRHNLVVVAVVETAVTSTVRTTSKASNEKGIVS